MICWTNPEHENYIEFYPWKNPEHENGARPQFGAPSSGDAAEESATGGQHKYVAAHGLV